MALQVNFDSAIGGIFDSYALTSNGFLPASQTPFEIRELYSPWMMIANNLSVLIASHTIKTMVDNLPFIMIDDLTTFAEFQTIYSMLCLIQAGYIWHNGEINHEHKVPAQIAVPLSIASSRLGIAPILTHGAIDLYNCRIKDPSAPPSLDNLESAFSLTGTESESWFCLDMVAIEFEGAKTIRAILEIQELYKLGGPNDQTIPPGEISAAIETRLQLVSDTIDTITKILSRMYEKCDPDTFYGVLRKFLNGWTDEKTFPNGMELEGVGSGIRYAGGSAAQSSIIQVYDIFFGVTHKNGFLKEMRNYMPGLHRDFLTYLESAPTMDVISKVYPDVIPIYNNCLSNLSMFRSKHMGLIHVYILNVAKKISVETQTPLAIKGTGGTVLVAEPVIVPGDSVAPPPEAEHGLLKMLKSFRTETDDKKINHNPTDRDEL
jgi:indoleamine 2,3-dioxygenase